MTVELSITKLYIHTWSQETAKNEKLVNNLYLLAFRKKKKKITKSRFNQLKGGQKV